MRFKAVPFEIAPAFPLSDVVAGIVGGGGPLGGMMTAINQHPARIECSAF